MKSRVYLNSAFLLRAAIGFSRHLTSAGEDSYSFNLYSSVCRISCTYFHLIRGFRFFSQKTSASMSLLLPVSSKNEGNLEMRDRFSKMEIVIAAAAVSGLMSVSVTRTLAQAPAASGTAPMPFSALKTPWGEPDLQG